MKLEEIAPRLKRIRADLHLRQSEIADRLGIGLSHWSKLETGVGGISPQLADLIYLKLGVREEWLLSGNGEPWDSGPPQLTVREERASYSFDRRTAPSVDEVINVSMQEDTQAKAVMPGRRSCSRATAPRP